MPTINQTVRAAALNVGAPNIVIMDTSHAFDGRRLCEDGTEKVGSVFGPTSVRQVYNNGAPVGGKCLRDGNGLNSFGEPNMRLDPL